MIQIELLTGDNYFQANPNNIMGTVGKDTTRWGEEISIVRSDEAIESIAARIMGTSSAPQQQPWHLAPTGAAPGKGKIVIDKATEREKAIIEAIRKTKEQATHPPSTTGIDMISFAEMQQKWGAKLSATEIEVWVWYQRGRLFSDSAILNPENGWSKFVVPKANLDKPKQWVKDGLLCFDGTEYIPAILFYAGNIANRMRKLAEYDERIIETIGKEATETQKKKLQESLPEMLKLSANENERLYISPHDPFVKNTLISMLADGTVLDEATNLLDAFEIWIENLSAEDFKNGSNSFQVMAYYIRRESFPRGTEDAVKVETKRKSQLDGLKLFSRFLFEGLTREDQQIVEHNWNADFNGFREYDFTKIPVGFEMNRYFKNALVDPKPVLWDGVKFLTVNGSGINAFDVGVGKTMCAILAVGQALYTGQCKRPLIVVPNPTYKKWISETVGEFNEDGTVKVNGILPQYRDRINDFYNLGVEHEAKVIKQWPRDYTITFITYEGLMKLGVSKTAREKLEGELYGILNQGDLKGRDQEKLREDIDKILGGLTSDTVANFDDLGFDYIVCDEAHNFKKIFTRVQGRVEEGGKDREDSPYQLSSGTPSGRGLKLFAFSQWVLRNNDMRNVVLLTATPFTNSPLEVYSMLSLVAYQQLEKRGITNLIDFFDKFINEESEMVVTVRGSLEEKPVIKSYNNRQVLQNIIFSSIIYRTGEEAGVQRPHKVVYPLIKDESGIFLKPEERIETGLRPTKDQEFWLREIARFANDENGNLIEPHIPKSMYDDNDRLLGRDLLAISLAKSVTLSPYLLHVAGKKLYNEGEPTYLEYIESSPKLEYTMECIKTVRKWHEKRKEPISGIILYMNMATDFFPLIAKYLVNKLGYEEKEVQIISGGITQDRKERIKDKFLNGEVKIIIGSATIKEGIDLQNRTTCLFNLNLDWNPTDIQQLEGRAWRQGNQHSFVRIVTPMVENSLDVFMFQKLEEKTSRINDIWYRAGRGNVLKLEDFDPKELKMGLMTDPAEKVKAEIKQAIQLLENRKTIADATVNKIGEARKAIVDLTSVWEKIEGYYDKARKGLEYDLQTISVELAEPELSKTDTDVLTARQISLSKVLTLEENEKTKIAICKRYAGAIIRKARYDWAALNIVTVCDEQIKRMALIEAIQKNVLDPKGLTMADELEPIILEATEESKRLVEEIAKLNSKEYQEKRIAEVRAEMEERKRNSKTIPERVTDFTRHNYLLSCLKGVHECSLKTHLIATIGKKAAVEPVISTRTEEIAPAATGKAQYYIDAANYNLSQISRTASGIVDATSTENKKEVFVTGADVAAITKKNFNEVIQSLYNDRSKEFKTVKDLVEFIEQINLKLIKGVTNITSANDIYRDEDSAKFNYTKHKLLVPQLADFASSILKYFQNGSELSEKDVLGLVAKTYWRINFTDHYFKDGCGKTAEAFAVYLLMRYGFLVPQLPDRKKWYELAPKERFNAPWYYNNEAFANFSTYLRDAEKIRAADIGKSDISTSPGKEKRLRIAKAKAAALKLKLQLQEPLKEAA